MSGQQTADLPDAGEFSTPSFWGDLNLRRNARKSHRFSHGGGNSKATESTSFPSACLPDQKEDLPVGTHCMIIGWGKKKSAHVYGTEVLHEAEVITYIIS